MKMCLQLGLGLGLGLGVFCEDVPRLEDTSKISEFDLLRGLAGFGSESETWG